MENISIIGRVGKKPSVYNRNGADRLMIFARENPRFQSWDERAQNDFEDSQKFVNFVENEGYGKDVDA